jgi:hypothetical protein
VSPELKQAVEQCAQRAGMEVADWHRRALASQVVREGGPVLPESDPHGRTERERQQDEREEGVARELYGGEAKAV